MDISLLAEASQRRIDNFDNDISRIEAYKLDEEAVRDKLHELMSQSTYTISDINFLIQAAQR
jgi:hypothetical protein